MDGMAPNLLLIMTDQHRFDYLGCAGARHVRTPNIDALAARGLRFTQCAVNAPVCAPSRIGLAAGLQPWRLGALGNNAFLPRGITTYYQRLRDAGYRVGCVGKLDLAKPDPYNGRHGDRPRVFGWGFTHPEECEGKMHAGKSERPLGPYGFWLQEKGLYRKFHEDYMRRAANGWVRDASHDSVLPTEAFEDAYIGRRAVDWLRDIGDDYPWHLFVSFVGPHDPFDPPAAYADLYRNREMPPAVKDDLSGKPACVQRRNLHLDDEAVAITRRQYCAAIELIDDQVGAIIDMLKKRGQFDNTIIVFTSDHGEMLGDHGLYTKSLPYEASVRAPLLVCGPGVLGDTVSDTLVELNDLNPTLCELAGLPPQPGIDARSLAPVLRGDSCAHRQDTVARLSSFTCLRTHTHKFITWEGGGQELYDLEDDPDELRNVIEDGEHADVLTDLRVRLRARLLEETAVG